jgi:hypothetical protein
MNAVVKPNHFLRKITPSTVTEAMGLDLLKLREIDGGKVKPRVLFELFGVVNRFKTGSTDKGPWVKFLGRFKAVTEADANGEVKIFESGAAHIPIMEDILYGAIEEARAGNPGKPIVVEIAFRVSIKTAPDGKPSATGYEFDVQPLVQRIPTADDPLERLMLEAKTLKLAQLSAPTPAPASTPTPVPEASAKGKK